MESYMPQIMHRLRSHLTPAERRRYTIFMEGEVGNPSLTSEGYVSLGSVGPYDIMVEKSIIMITVWCLKRYHHIMTENQQIILITGFGPFGIHKINASWEAVKLLPDQFGDYKLVKSQIPVCYKDVDEKIPDLWISLKPKLVIHVGVSSEARKITIEKVANRHGYERLDCYGEKHTTGNVCPPNLGEDCINTAIKIPEICETLNMKNDVIQYCSSENAGRYLCEYIYYTSLRQDRNKCIFVHVPPLESPYTAEQLRDGILQIIDCIIKQGVEEVCECAK